MWKIKKVPYYIKLEGKINWGVVLKNLGIFMLIPPIVGIPMVIYSALRNRKNDYSVYMAYFFCLAAYFASINATKSPGGDQIQYVWAYLNVPSQGFIGSLKNIYGYAVAHGKAGAANISGEFMNGVINYFGYYLTFGQYWLFIFFYSFIEHLLIFLGIYHYCRTLRNCRVPIICGPLILAFFYLFFNLSLQIQKQFFAQAIVMYVIGRYSRAKEMDLRSWVFMAIAIFTHASTLVFIPFFIYKPLREKLNFSTLSLLIGLLVLFVLVGPSVFNDMNFEDSGVLGYGMERFTNTQKSDDGIQFSYTDYRTLIISIPMLYCMFKSFWAQRKLSDHSDSFIMNITALFMVAIIAMTGRPLLQYRYFMVLYFFMPFVYPSAFYNIKKRNTVLQFAALFFIAYFYLMFEDIIWDYAPESHIIMYPPGLFMGLDHYVKI